ncbi:Alpha/Beta hydrolase protein [Geopyxis carbonaria]|nr:Alpha/Beta hydrolase protein [Geopyxis carbonaria]
MPIPTENGHQRPTSSSHTATGHSRTSSTTTAYPPPFIINPTDTHTHTLILLHGRGDTGPSFGSLFYTSSTSSDFRLAALYPGLRFVFPTTASRWSEKFRHHMTEWFGGADDEGLREGVAWVHGLIRAELAAGLAARRIFVGGISQGAAVALWTALTWPGERLGGLVGMSTWFPRAPAVLAEWRGGGGDDGGAEPAEPEDPDPAPAPAPARAPDENTMRALRWLKESLDQGHEAVCPDVVAVPVFLGHGDADEVVDYGQGRQVYELLSRCLGMSVTWRRYRDYGHWYKQPDEIDDIIAFLGERCGLLPS